MTLFLIGLAASIPLSIFANMMTPRIQRAIEKRSGKARAKTEAKRREEKKIVDWFSEHPAEFRTYMIFGARWAMVNAAMAAFGTCAGIGAFLIGLLRGGDDLVVRVPAYALSCLAVGIVMLCTNLTMNEFSTLSRVFTAVAMRSGWPVNPRLTSYVERESPERSSTPLETGR